MDSLEFINEILNLKDSNSFKEHVEFAIIKIREDNLKYKLLNEVINGNILNPVLIKISDIKVLHEIFIESLVGMDKEKFDNYLFTLDRRKKMKYLFNNIDNMSYNCLFEKMVIDEFIVNYQKRSTSIKNFFINKIKEEEIYNKCLEKKDYLHKLHTFDI